MSQFRQDFLQFALRQNVLKFGEFTTKAGRQSPYFFNAGLFNDGASTLALAKFYAQAIVESQVRFDMLFGPAYKGIILAAATAMMLAERGINVPFAYNRKEAKDHGEGGTLVGAPLQGRVLIIDDVISAGTSVRESVNHGHHGVADFVYRCDFAGGRRHWSDEYYAGVRYRAHQRNRRAHGDWRAAKQHFAAVFD